MSKVYRVYVEKRKENSVEAHDIRHNLRHQLGLKTVKDVRVLNRYDLQGINEDVLKMGVSTILSEPMTDEVYLEDYPSLSQAKIFAVEYLPGQYDVRADFAQQCFQLLSQETNIKIKYARVYEITGINEKEMKLIEDFFINPVDSRLAKLEKPETLDDQTTVIKEVPIIKGFRDFSVEQLNDYIRSNGMAMN